MGSAFDKAVEWVLEVEGLLSNHGEDPGGLTKFGVTQARWQEFRRKHPDGQRLPASVKDITRGHAIALYEEGYWRGANCHKVAEVSEFVAIELFEAGVNVGIRTGQMFLQQALNLMRHPGTNALLIDGIIGPATLERLRELSPQYDLNILTAQNGFQFQHYAGLIRQNPDRFLHFSRGWMKRVQLYGEHING